MPKSVREKLAQKKSKLAQPQEPVEDHPADVNDYQDGGFFRVDVELVKPNPYQPRKTFDPERLAELSQSIKEKGVLQPVIIRRDEAGDVYLVAGERRLRAAKMAGLEKIPAILTKGNPAEIALIENLQRENLSPVEESEALARMAEDFEYTQEQLALVVGKARTTITESLSLNRLPESIKEECRRADIYPRRLLVEIAKQETPKEMIALFERVKEGGLKSDQVRAVTRKQRVERAPLAITMDKISGLLNNLSKIEFERLNQDEKIHLMSALQELRQSIIEIIG
ncbi:MAG: ParB/RepB/Spo0J family partition protein [Deltaproteobacteria bacterium]|nr:MAG: ParB/RepB/Spo0J family partition protein [Deltaproteobacteria bacterium]